MRLVAEKYQKMSCFMSHVSCFFAPPLQKVCFVIMSSRRLGRAVIDNAMIKLREQVVSARVHVGTGLELSKIEKFDKITIGEKATLSKTLREKDAAVYIVNTDRRGSVGDGTHWRVLVLAGEEKEEEGPRRKKQRTGNKGDAYYYWTGVAYYLDPLGTRQGAGTKAWNDRVRTGLATMDIELGNFKSVSGWKQKEGSLDCGFVCLAMVAELVRRWEEERDGVLRPWYPDESNANCLVPTADWQVAAPLVVLVRSMSYGCVPHHKTTGTYLLCASHL
jgi:hypothetical protein